MPPPWTPSPGAVPSAVLSAAPGVPAPRAEGTPGAGAGALSAAVWELDLTTGTLTWSAGMHRLVGSTAGGVTPSLAWWMSLVVPEDRARVRAGLLVVRETLRGGEDQFRMVGVDGVERCVHAWSEVETDAGGSPVRMFGSAVDVTGLARLGSRDPLTGLVGRPALQVHLAAALGAPCSDQAGGGGHGRRAGLLLVDLDRFSVLDDALGRAAGDALLASCASRLRALAPPGATVARMDGDTFAVLLPGGGPAGQAEELAAQVVAAARQPHALPERPEHLTATASVGVAVVDGEDAASAGTDAEDLLRHAGLALRRAKQDGRDRVVVYTPDLGEAAAARVRSEAVLRSALDAGRLQVLYQPVVDLGSGEVAGVEALARIVDPELGPLSPALFVGVSEETGLVVRLDEWVLGRASAMAARWRPPPPGAVRPTPRPSTSPSAPPTVAVNMSSRTLARPDLAPLVRGALRLSGTSPSRLLVEITEHSLLDQGPAARDTLDGLQALGVGVGIDDFGTGWSALSYLSALDLSFMKIDRCFVSRLGTDASATAVVKAVIDLAHAHRLSVVAEGVETEDQARRLAALGCDHGQGWWFGRPTAEADLDGAVRAWYQRAADSGYGAWAPERTAPAGRVLSLLG